MKNTFAPNHLFLTIIFLFALVPLSASVQDSIVSYFDIIHRVSQEKTHLHIDKPYYGAGDRIWFKGYLVNAITHRDDAASNFIYVELRDRRDSILQKQKIKRDTTGFKGNFLLAPELAAGDYYLRAYSSWMQNEDPAYFFTQNLKVGNSIAVDILSSIHYLSTPDKLQANIRFFNKQGGGFGQTKIRYEVIQNKKIVLSGNSHTHENGYMQLEIPQKITNHGALSIHVRFLDDMYEYDRAFFVPDLSQDYSLSFFPEGGDLLPLPNQIVAFKAQGKDGFSKEVKGYLLNQKEDTISFFSSAHDGMGRICFTPVVGESYHTITISTDSIQKRSELPAVKPSGIKLSVVYSKNLIRYQVSKTDNIAWPDSLFLVAHIRGALRILTPLDASNFSGRINDSTFEHGIAHFLLINNEGIPLSERLLFIDKGPYCQWELASKEFTKEKRQKETIVLHVKDNQGNPLKGNYSVSITDKNAVKDNPGRNHILSNLLLTSDLKGYIENPGYYFSEQTATTRSHLDLVMLTHGWRRFRVESFMEKPSFNISNYKERGQTISGKIINLFGKNAVKAPIVAVSPKLNLIKTTETDENGIFVIDGIDIQDTATFILQARTNKGYANVEIRVDTTREVVAIHQSPYLPDSLAPSMEKYLEQTRDNYFNEGGLKVVNLKEILIQGRRSNPAKENIYSSFANHSMTGQDIANSGAFTAMDLIDRMPGITRNGDELKINGSNSGMNKAEEQLPMILIGNVSYDNVEVLYSLNAKDIERIDILKGENSSMFGPRGSGGAIIITPKPGAQISSRKSLGIITLPYFGYHVSTDFYTPVYDTPEKLAQEKSDIRTTIYWNPSINSDSTGAIRIEYYLPDNPVSPHIIIEGIGKNGEICHYSIDL